MCKCINSALKSKNIIVKTCINQAINGSDSEISRTINLLCYKYNISKKDIYIDNVFCNLNTANIKCQTDPETERKASLKRDFCYMRDSIFTSFEDKINAKFILNEICIN